MQTKKKNKKPVKIVSKPFLHGDMTDQHTLGSSIKFFLSMIGMAMAFLALGTTLAFDFAVLTYLLNGCLVAAALLLYLNGGSGKAVAVVTQGEVLQARLDDGRNVDKNDRRAAFHQYKGLIAALLGTLPFFILAVILACTAERHLPGCEPADGYLPAGRGGV